MFKSPGINPLCYVIERQYLRNYVIKSKLFNERLSSARNLYRKDLFAHYGCVNAIEFSKEGELLISGGDDRRVLLWSLPKVLFGDGNPVAMHTDHSSNIFCLDFNSNNTRIFSGGNDDQAIVHDVNTRYFVVKLPHKKPVYGLNINPQNDNILATAGDDGRILLYDLRETPNSDAVQCLAKQKTGFHSVMFNPINPRWLTTANSDEGIALWDCRKPREQLIHFDADVGHISGISSCFNSTGTHILALRRRLPPVLYDTQKPNAICQFYHPQYYNSCTMKTCCFAGEDDEYVLSGSDDFNLYMWNIPKSEAEWGTTHLVLKDHRSIVNQVRYNKQNNLIASSGVEKMVKLWSTLPIGSDSWKGSLLKEQSDPARTVYTHDEYIYLVGSAGERISHDYSEHSTQEDAKMMAFFDSLIQREIEGWNSNNPTDESDTDSDTQAQEFDQLSKTMFLKTKISREDNKQPNKIAELIAKKKSCLAKMAHEKSPSYILKNNEIREKLNEQNGFHKYKSSKQKHANCTKSSQEKYHSGEKVGKKHKLVPNKSKLKKYRTRQSLREICDNGNNSLDGPSTSTGITGSHNSLFRVIEQDSEEDAPPTGCVENGNEGEENLVNILPTPINGTHDMFINVLEMTRNVINGGDSGATREDGAGRPSTSRQNRHRYDSAVCIDGGSERAASSNGVTRFPRSSFNGSYPPLAVNGNNTDSDSDYACGYVTPIKKRRTISASDSGFGTGSCSTVKTRDHHNHQQECSNSVSCSSEDELNYEKFRKRVKKARLNLRKEIAADSDSN
ncbi:hypothetical protein WA026_007789 [Henosepilachna vigintioctopunctata]|uniref:DDB1- and CUL4-associated factor 5 n=1 Tax=Henosepilachna vigintioctopunctata TaxID=420089 RepID=A0AAW1U412_9CUCU